MGGRPFMGGEPLHTYDDLSEQVRAGAGARSLLLLPPLMHGAAQWGVFNTITSGGWIAVPDDVRRFHADDILRLAERERVLGIPWWATRWPGRWSTRSRRATTTCPG